MVLAVIATKLIPPLDSIELETPSGVVDQILEGLQHAWADVAIRIALIQIFGLAIFFSGAYMVLLPVMIRELYGGGSIGLAGGFGFNLAGTVLATLVLMRLGKVLHPGRALTLGMVISCSVLLTFTTTLPTWLFFIVVFLWGAGGGLIVIMSRSIVQESAPETHRARIMSIFSLAMMGGSPIGSLLMGLIIDEVGIHQATFFPVIGMVIVGSYRALRTPLWSITRKSSS